MPIAAHIRSLGVDDVMALQRGKVCGTPPRIDSGLNGVRNRKTFATDQVFQILGRKSDVAFDCRDVKADSGRGMAWHKGRSSEIPQQAVRACLDWPGTFVEHVPAAHRTTVLGRRRRVPSKATGGLYIKEERTSTVSRILCTIPRYALVDCHTSPATLYNPGRANACPGTCTGQSSGGGYEVCGP